jgi:hypothetical protein
VIGGRGGYVSLAHIVLRFTRAAISMGGATWLNVAGICRVLAMSLIFLGIFISSNGRVFVLYI